MKWEYSIEHVGGNYSMEYEVERKLEAMGENGWELASILRDPKHPRDSDGSQYQSFTLYFKRPKQ